ncbi:hypothetical protein HNQ07_000432 [Deinococcus metalli]|uniref:DUF927 domain-containing protein n=1 Tax=Deinococcus metalli TaxID=1141878 RepID=A0A7W8NPM3_9DEIO|nr:DUF927 domain-containing protein [Deinococcus metalli]MBB5374988.1 hypothetical protein [Deinococcus metalli]GHF32264.1 hypothetical protein GCM10017781_06110 [Deinococcus metalli]
MSALHGALTHPANRPGPLVRWLAAQVNPGADLTGLRDAGGTLCDFRHGLEEHSPSLSASVGRDGAAVFHRFGGDDFEGGAVEFTASCLGIPKGEAARLLIDRAGLVDSAPHSSECKTVRAPQPTGRTAAGLAKARAALDKLRPLADDRRDAALRGWMRIDQAEDTSQAQEVARRGLSPALASGLLTAYRWTGDGSQDGGTRRRATLPRHILPGALAFEVTGPDGTPWAVKARNPGTKTELQAVNAQRYVYVTAGQSTPAFCGPGQLEGGRAFLIVEGELNAAACVVMLTAAGHGDAYAVQGVASAVAFPHVAHVPAGARVCVYADPDDEGTKARTKWADVLAAQGCHVFQVAAPGSGQPSPFAVEGNPDADACDALGTVPEGEAPDAHAAHRGALLLAALHAARRWQPDAQEPPDRAPTPGQSQPGDVWESRRHGYGVRGGRLCALSLKKGEDGEDFEAVEVLADFSAFITAEVIEDDGSGEARRVFQIEGRAPDGAPLFPPVVTVPTSEFSGMSWPVAKWGGAARVPAGQGKKDKARDAVQVLSNAQGYARRTVYQHTGWITHPEHGPVYLTAGAVIGATGAVDGVAVDLAGRLDAYALPDPVKDDTGAGRTVDELRAAVRASLDLLTLAPDPVAVPMLGAAYRAILGPADFVVWTVGETGRHKTAFMGLVMAHYGARWGRKFLPDGWNSSANALESSAFRVKDALFVIDDFKPAGSLGDRARLDGAASRVIQGAADGAGRGTLTADRKSRAALYPRGLIATSAEDLPRGHSNRARLVMVEVLRPLIDSPAKSAAYHAGEERAAVGVYALALAGFVQAVASAFEDVRAGSAAHLRRVRALAPDFQGVHGRTGDAAAELAYGWEVFLSYAVAVGAVSTSEAGALWERVTGALGETARGQGEHLQDADPVARALAVLSGLLAQGRVYLEDLRVGGKPEAHAAPLCGWQRHGDRGQYGEEDTFTTKPGAVMVGYYSRAGGNEWGHFLPDGLHEAVQRAVTGQGGAALPDPSKLWGNLRDRLHAAGLMKCDREGTRVRATARATLPNGTQQALITLRLPIGAPYQSVVQVVQVGHDGEESTSDTGATACTTLNLYPFSVVQVVQEGAAFPLVSSPFPSDAPPRSLTLEDLEGLAEGEDMPGVVML